MNLEGRLIGNRYEILEIIGKGGMATVYKAQDQILKRYVAVKVLREEFTTDEEEVGSVIKQSKRAGSKTHENAVITLTVGVLDTRVKVPDVRGLTLEEAADTLNQVGIFYQVVYEESDEDTNIVLDQSVRAGKVIDNTESITLTVSVSNNQSESSSPIVDDDSDSTTDDTNTDDEVSDKLN